MGHWPNIIKKWCDDRFTNRVLSICAFEQNELKLFSFFLIFNVKTKKSTIQYYMPAGSKTNLGGSCIYYKE